MLGPEYRQGDKEKDLLITVPISSDGDKQMQEGEDAVARTGKRDSLSFPCSWGRGSKEAFGWLSPSPSTR